MSIATLEKAAEEAMYLSAPGYDMTIEEAEFLYSMIKRSPTDAFYAILKAYRSGYTRGHMATIRGRIKGKPRTKRG